MVVAVNHSVNKSSLKRKSFCVAKPNSFSVSFATNKRVCIAPSVSRRNSVTFYSSSSSDDNDDDSDSEAGYINNQKRAKKRAFSTKRSSSFTNIQLSHAISKYSDVEEDEDDHDQDKKPKLSDLTSNSIKSDVETKSHSGSISGSSFILSDSRSSSRKLSLEQDQIARNHCFDYLVGAIDEAWARYCDATSFAEEEAYRGGNDYLPKPRDNDYLPTTPVSLGPSEYEYDDDENEREDEEHEHEHEHEQEQEQEHQEEEHEHEQEQEQQEEEEQQQQLKGCDDSEESDDDSITYHTPIYSSDVERRSSSLHPRAIKLQGLKDRLLKAKYYLQEFLDTTDVQDAIAFWRRWDLVKYATIEVVEDDDDDEIIEATIDDLEKGRLYGCF